MRDAKSIIALAASVLLVAPLIFWAAARYAPAPQSERYTVPGHAAMAADAVQDDLFSLLPALLLEVYDAFGRSAEAEIYDTLAVVASGPALETLYLERAGAMFGGGLTEAEQEIHEMRLTKASSYRNGDVFRLDAQWEVIGTVGHSEHIHVRGNTYSADLTIAPVEGAWKITQFELTDVDRQTAGEFVEADRAWWN